MTIEVMKQALEAFEWNLHTDLNDIRACEQWANMLKKNISTLRAAIDAELEQAMLEMWQTPREWVGLTEIEICDIEADELTSASSETFSFARAIEAKLKEKNHDQ